MPLTRKTDSAVDANMYRCNKIGRTSSLHVCSARFSPRSQRRRFYSTLFHLFAHLQAPLLPYFDLLEMRRCAANSG